MTSLLVELQTEELPPKALLSLSQAFAEGIEKTLRDEGVLSATSSVTVFGAPRRLGVHITDVLAQGEAQAFSQRLVPVSVGLKDGQPTVALTKKMAALGLDNVPVSALQVQHDGKQDQLVYEGVREGVKLEVALQKAIDYAVTHLPIPKVMHYQLADGVTTVEFVRPAKHLVALHGDKVVPVSVLGLTADRMTRGHRFHTTEPVSIANADSYESTMHAAKVMPRFDARRAALVEKLEARAKELHLTAIAPDHLVDEVTALTEWPVIYTSQFDEAFLEVPSECLILTMQLNQKYFALRDDKGALSHQFLLVSHLEAKDGGQAIASGNARVVRARLADAKFFYDQDKLATLESRVPGLEHVVYHNKLGTQLERMERVKAMAGLIADRLGANRHDAERAAYLAKADLRTLMVGEFPELQGIMGEYYAKHDKEAPNVALAIREHYQPRFAGDELPSTPVSMAVALADKMETLTGLFGIGQLPTGEKDPFALRRHALGVLRMLMTTPRLGLKDLIDLAWGVEERVAGTQDPREALVRFMLERLRVMLKDLGFTTHEVEAVMAIDDLPLNEAVARLEAVRDFSQRPEAESLSAANKRIQNILKKIEGELPTAVAPARFVADAERQLWDAMEAVRPEADALFARQDYKGMLGLLSQLKTPVDAFFESVMVNDPDEALRANRQALLVQLAGLMNRVAALDCLA